MGIPDHFGDVFHRVGGICPGAKHSRADVHSVCAGINSGHTLIQVFGRGQYLNFFSHSMRSVSFSKSIMRGAKLGILSVLPSMERVVLQSIKRERGGNGDICTHQQGQSD
jgi:hypothetical protein